MQKLSFDINDYIFKNFDNPADWQEFLKTDFNHLPEISFIESVSSTEIHLTNLEEVFEIIRDGTFAETISSIRQTDNKEKRTLLKKRLPAILFGGRFKTRKELEEASNLLCLDFDHVENISRYALRLPFYSFIYGFFTEEIKSNKIYEHAFEWRFEFPEVLNDDGDFVGFDVVIGNPPYISLTKMKGESHYFDSSDFMTYSKGADIYCLFYERGNQILKNSGILTYITSNSWLKVIYGELLKKYFIEHTQPLVLINIEDVQLFEEATVESNIMVLQKKLLHSPIMACNLSKDYSVGTSINEYLKANQFNLTVSDKSTEWIIRDQESSNIIRKIAQSSKLLKDFKVNINFGVKTGYNTAFIISETKKEELISSDKENKKIIKPILRGRDISKYHYNYANIYLICTFPSLNLEIDDYPSVKDYLLDQGKERLEQSGKKGSRKKTNNKWFETQDSIAYWKDFNNPKIVWGEISDKPKFAYDDCKYCAEATTFMMTGEKLKYLIAILNSKVSEWYFNQISTTTGMGTNRWKKYKIEMLPIKIPTNTEENKLINLVDQIKAHKKENRDIKSIENDIDQAVFDLYGLTEKEIKIIKESTK